MTTTIGNPELRDKAAKAKQRLDIARNLFVAVACIAAILTCIVVTYQVTELYDVGTQSRANLRLLVDCTTPGGHCYEEGNKRTAAAVGSINEIVILASFCAHQPENSTPALIRSCVEKEYAKVK